MVGGDLKCSQDQKQGRPGISRRQHQPHDIQELPELLPERRSVVAVGIELRQEFLQARCRGTRRWVVSDWSERRFDSRPVAPAATARRDRFDFRRSKGTHLCSLSTERPNELGLTDRRARVAPRLCGGAHSSWILKRWHRWQAVENRALTSLSASFRAQREIWFFTESVDCENRFLVASLVGMRLGNFNSLLGCSGFTAIS